MARVVFVCSGNICRSPTAEVVLRTLAERAGHAAEIEIGSAGTGGWHAGEEMDRRSRATLEAAGYRPGQHVARRFRTEDFGRHDVVVALDHGHRDELWDLAGNAADPAAARATIVLLRDYDPERPPGESADVADPYYGGPSGFTDVLDQIERSCGALLDALTSRR
jgi:protein-tyrosine phosphatase